MDGPRVRTLNPIVNPSARDTLPSSGYAIFRTLIAAKDSAFPAPFQPPPATVYYPKFGGSLAAIISQKGDAWGVDGFPAISVKFLMMSRGTSLVVEMRKVAVWKGSDQGSGPKKGRLVGD